MLIQLWLPVYSWALHCGQGEGHSDGLDPAHLLASLAKWEGSVLNKM
jgi:hypothetical protein